MVRRAELIARPGGLEQGKEGQRQAAARLHISRQRGKGQAAMQDATAANPPVDPVSLDSVPPCIF